MVPSERGPHRAVTTWLAVLTAGVVNALVPGAAPAQAAEDSVAVRAWIDAYVAAWDTHDASVLADFFTDDAYFAMGNQPAARGRQAIQDAWRGYFANQEPERRLTLDVRTIRFVAPDVAVVNVGTTTGGRDGEGRELRARRFRGAWVVHGQDGTWRIASMVGVPTEEDRVVLGASVEAAATLRPGIRAFVAAYEDAFNSHDPAALRAFYRDDADLIIRNGPVMHGRQAIRVWWQRYFSEPRPYRALFIPEDIRMVTADVALVDLVATGATAGATARPTSVRYARATWLLVREDERWLLAAVWVLPGEDDRILRAGGG